MVLRGQFLERPTLIPVTPDLVLEGVSHRGKLPPIVLVLPPPPQQGSGMDHVVGAEVAYAVTNAGHPCLRFNYRGVGGSQGERSFAPTDMLEDAQAALLVAAENAAGFGVLVVSLGASDAIAFRLASDARVVAICCITPSLVRAPDLAALRPLPVTLVVPAFEDVDKESLGTALEARGGKLVIVPGATSAYQRNLPLVGKEVVALAKQTPELT
jgi:uncharacterized protein